MTDATAEPEAQDQAPEDGKPSGKAGLILGIALALVGGAAGYFVTTFLSPAPEEKKDTHVEAKALPDLAFVELDQMIVALRDTGGGRHLRFRAQLEVVGQYHAEVAHLKPRIVDVINGYLRALHPSDFEDPLILPKLRSQLLRRIQIVAGEGRVRDVLIMEFILT